MYVLAAGWSRCQRGREFAVCPRFDSRGYLEQPGRAVSCEIIQYNDGIPEADPAATVRRADPVIDVPLGFLRGEVHREEPKIALNASQQPAEAPLTGLPKNTRITLRLSPLPNTRDFGLHPGCSDKNPRGYELRLARQARTVNLYDEKHILHAANALDQTFSFDVILKDDIVDVCIDNRRTLICLVLSWRVTNFPFVAKAAAFRWAVSKCASCCKNRAKNNAIADSHKRSGESV